MRAPERMADVVTVGVDCVVRVEEDVEVVAAGGGRSEELLEARLDKPRAARRASAASRSFSSSSLSLSSPPSPSKGGAKGGWDRSKVCLLKLHCPPH